MDLYITENDKICTSCNSSHLEIKLSALLNNIIPDSIPEDAVVERDYKLPLFLVGILAVVPIESGSPTGNTNNSGHCYLQAIAPF